jgi:hypothetical protein
MAVKMRRNFAGAMRARRAADGSWRITRSDPVDVPADRGPTHRGPTDLQIVVIGADSRRVTACGSTLHDLDIEWQGHRVLLTTVRAGAAKVLEARSVIVHEPLPRLYEALPLADFDARARRFWRRVFLLVRVPGGRRLLGMLARLNRNKR